MKILENIYYHPKFVHFPQALFPVSFLSFVVYVATGAREFEVGSFIAALFGTLIIEPAKDTQHRLRWSAWRRRHQHRARRRRGGKGRAETGGQKKTPGGFAPRGRWGSHHREIRQGAVGRRLRQDRQALVPKLGVGEGPVLARGELRGVH